MLQIKLRIELDVCIGIYINKNPFYTNCELFIIQLSKRKLQIEFSFTVEILNFF